MAKEIAMSENAYWTVKAYNWDSQTKNFVLSEWASGFSYSQAERYLKQLRDTKSFARLEMTKVIKEYPYEIRN